MDPLGPLSLLIPLAGMGTGVIFMAMLYRLINRWIERRQVTGQDEVVADLARLRAEIEMLGDVPDRLQELEERVDFAERVIAQKRQERLPAGD